MKKNKVISNPKLLLIILHIITLFFVVVIVISFVTMKSIILKLPVGASLPLIEIANRLKIKYSKQYYSGIILLSKFEKNNIKKNNRNILNYKSYITIKDNSIDIKDVVMVNHPSYYKKIKFYQQDWTFAAYNFVFLFNGVKYDLKKDKEKDIKIDDNHSFVFFPMDMQGDKIVYEWNILNDKNKIVKKGYFTKDMLNNYNYLVKTFNFKIIQDEIYPVSVLQVSYKPFNILLAISASIFIFFLIFYFLVIKFTKSRNIRMVKEDSNE